MSLTLGRRHRTNPARGVRRRCTTAGNHRLKSRGRDRRPRGERRGLAAAPAPVPAGASQGYGKMARQHSAQRIGGLVRQGEQPGKRGSQRRAPSAPNDKMSSNRGCRGTPQTRLLRERDRQKATMSRSVPKRGVSHRQAVISGSFPLTNRYTPPGRGLNKPLYFSRKGLNQQLYFAARIY